jgi:hypothetical protein
MSTKLKDSNMNEIETEEEEMYEVEEILDKKKIGAKWKYQIKWVGYGLDQTTWEPAENLENVDSMLKEFEKNWQKDQKKKEIKKTNQESKKSTSSNKKFMTQSTSLNKIEENKFNPRPLKSQQENKLPLNHHMLNKKRKANEDQENNQIMADSPKINSPNNVPQSNPIVCSNSVNNQRSTEKSFSLREVDENIVNSAISQSKTINRTIYQTEEAIIIGEEENISPKVYGSFEFKDLPKRLITAKLVGPNNEVNCLVEWMPRENGIKPAESFVSNKFLREKCPNILLDFYESRLRFPSKTTKTENK